MASNRTKIFIYTTKDIDKYPDNDNYAILTDVDVNLSEKPLPVIRSTIHEFSPRRGSYLELNGIYALYSGRTADDEGCPVELPEYIGICHHDIYIDIIYNTVSDEVCDALFSKYDMVCGIPGKLDDSLYKKYDKSHDVTKLDEIIDIIEQTERDYYDACNSTLNKQYMISGNIFVMRREYFKELCRFAFNVLREFDRRHRLFTHKDVIEYIENNWNGSKDIDDVGGIVVQSRFHSRIFEILLNVFVHRWFSMEKIATFPFKILKK